MLKTLLAQVKEYKRDSLLTPLFIVLEVIMEVIIPVMMAEIIDNGVEKGNMKYVVIMGITMVVAAMLSLSFGALAGKYAASASSGFAKNLRGAMFKNIQNFSFSNIDKYSTAGLVTRLTTDITNVQNSYQMVIRLCVRAPIMLISAMAMAFMINAKLACIFLGAIAFLSCVLAYIILHAHPIFTKVFRKYDDLNASVQENVNAIRVVKAYVREDYEINKFHTASNNIYNLFVKAEKLIIMNGPAMMFSMYACIILLSWLGAKLIVVDELATGQLMSLFTYVINILMSLMMISMAFVMITMSKASAERIAEVLNEKSDLVNGENPSTDIKDGSIEFRDVSFSYKKDINNCVLEKVNLEIKSGETIGIIGGTGSAKTTFVQLIPRLYDTTAGQVLVGGKDVKEYDIESLRDEVAMVLQKNVLFSGTIKENLRWGNKDATDEEMLHACELAQADEFIQRFPDGYDTYIEQGGNNVSGGQKQRLCIARALLKKPKILILDDSTSAVDTKTDSLIRKAFKDEIPNTTKIIIAQRISSVQDADRIIVLNEGVVENIGTHEELLINSPIYRDVYESQTKGAKDHGEE
ncbi:lipid A export ATP-binding/permease protein MsbA [Lachnospiraceae bacterium KM106-2]|nr:lipid A export ATP-binding/permease protein MsbA [Lachnospiraceae bacterium KM106-2]